jgi:tRNA dimethylallyltransferase
MPASEKPVVVAIVGPTASGKTGLSLDLAEELNAEIIACDSRTIYRYFDIGTAKPTPEEQARVRHFGIDIADPGESYTVAQYVEHGRAAIADIVSRGKLPIVTGGTGFYARALLEGLTMPAVAPQEELRRKLRLLADEQGNEALYRRLQAVDPDTAARLNSNDRFRIIRALEVFEITGMPFSQAARREDPAYRTIWIGLTADDRSILHRAIEKRFHEQLQAGLLEETERLYARYGANQRMMNTVNYKQLVQLIEGKIDRDTAYQQAIQHNVQLARRQLIWFRANRSISWFAIDSSSKADLRRATLSHIKEGYAK